MVKPVCGWSCVWLWSYYRRRWLNCRATRVASTVQICQSRSQHHSPKPKPNWIELRITKDSTTIRSTKPSALFRPRHQSAYYWDTLYKSTQWCETEELSEELFPTVSSLVLNILVLHFSTQQPWPCLKVLNMNVPPPRYGLSTMVAIFFKMSVKWHFYWCPLLSIFSLSAFSIGYWVKFECRL